MRRKTSSTAQAKVGSDCPTETRTSQNRRLSATTSTCAATPYSPTNKKSGGSKLSRLMKPHFVSGLSVVLLAILMVLRNQLPNDNPSEEGISMDRPPSSGFHKGVLNRDPSGAFRFKPRIVTVAVEADAIPTRTAEEHLPLFIEGKEGSNKRHRIQLSEEELEAQDRIRSNSKDYSKKAESMYTDDPPCEPQYQWQTHVFPVCNILHEFDLTDLILPANTPEPTEPEKFRFLATGGYRDVYMVRDRDHWDHKLALKTLKYTREFTERHYDRHRRDAMAAAHLTSTPTSVDIYGFCGQSALYPFAKGGNLQSAIRKNLLPNGRHNWNSAQKLQIAYMVASSLADLHNVDQEGRASIAHTDISTDQFISLEGDGVFLLNDFNRARFLKRNTHDHSQNCPFYVKSNKGKFRSPEEYNYDGETEAVDTYSMGNIFFVLLTGTYPFQELSKSKVKKAVGRGERPAFGTRLEKSDDPNEQALIQAAKMCWVYDPTERASAREVQVFLKSKLPS